MRNFINIVESLVVTESQNYEAMFNKIIPNLNDEGVKHIQDHIKWAKKTLRKNDRIVWYLKYIRGLYEKNSHDQNPEEHSPFDGMRTRLEHFLSLPVADIQNYVFAADATHQKIIIDLTNFENDWKAKANQVIDAGEGEEIIREFPDGFAWVMLHRGACSIEGAAMGHCGNVPSEEEGQRILSLRKKVSAGGSQRWRPSLTFILNKDGTLGEMKGRANNKPDAKYHPHILALLKMPLIKGIEGGGYAAGRNFHLGDLSDENVNDLVTARPDLFSVDPISGDKLLELVKNVYNDDNPDQECFIPNDAGDIVFVHDLVGIENSPIFEANYYLQSADLFNALDPDHNYFEIMDNSDNSPSVEHITKCINALPEQSKLDIIEYLKNSDEFDDTASELGDELVLENIGAWLAEAYTVEMYASVEICDIMNEAEAVVRSTKVSEKIARDIVNAFKNTQRVTNDEGFVIDISVDEDTENPEQSAIRFTIRNNTLNQIAATKIIRDNDIDAEAYLFNLDDILDDVTISSAQESATASFEEIANELQYKLRQIM